MSERLARAVLEITTDDRGLITGLDEAIKKAGGLQSAFGKVGKDLQQWGRDTSAVGKTLSIGLTAPIVGVGVALGKAAADFESSFAGVRKTVDATEPELQVLAQGFRDMAREIPVSVNEINSIGEAAGQLGIKTENILGFTRVMADLGATTNLSAEEAATALARLANITGMPQTEFDRLGSTIVALGNNFATTEREIVEMSLRLAGAGNQIGLTEGEILGFATALSSVGIEAEAGGSAFSKVMINMASAASEGGESLDQFARVAGMSSEEFQRAFREDAASAINAFVLGLGSIQESGGDLIGTLNEMGVTEVRMRDALLRSAGAGDLVTRALQVQGEAWRDNTALTKEAEQRYQTFSSQLTLLKNELYDMAIEVGTALLPTFRSFVDLARPLLEWAREAAQWFAALPEPVRAAAVVIAGLAAGIGPVVFVAGQLITAVGTIAAALGTGGALTTGLALATTAFKGLAATLITPPVGVVIAIGALVAVLANSFTELQRVRGELERYREESARTANQMRDWKAAAAEFAGVLNATRGTWQEQRAALEAYLQQLAPTKAQVIELSNGLRLQMQAGNLSRDAFDSLQAVLRTYIDQMGMAKRSTDDVAAATAAASREWDHGIAAFDAAAAASLQLAREENEAAIKAEDLRYEAQRLNQELLIGAPTVDAYGRAIAQVGANSAAAVDDLAMWARALGDQQVMTSDTGAALAQLGLDYDDMAAGWQSAIDEMAAASDDPDSPTGPGFWGKLGGAIVEWGRQVLDVISNLFGVKIPAWASAGLNAVISFMTGDWKQAITSAIAAVVGIIKGMFDKADARSVAEGWGLALSDALADELQKQGEQLGGDFGLAILLNMDRVIRENTPRTLDAFRELEQKVWDVLSAADRGDIPWAVALEAFERGLDELVTHLDSVGGSAMELQDRFSNLLTLAHDGFLDLDEVTRIMQEALQEMAAAGVDGVQEMIDWLATLGIEIEDVGDVATGVGNTMKATWQDAFKVLGISSSFFFGQTKKDAIEAIKALGLSAELEAKLIAGIQKDANKSFREELRELARERGLTEEETRELILASIRAQRQAERDKNKERRQNELDQIDSGKLVRDRLITFAEQMRDAWLDAYREIGAAAAGMAAGLSLPGSSSSSASPGGPLGGRAFGSPGTMFEYWGSGTPMLLHGMEAIVTQPQGASLAAMVGAAIKDARSSGGDSSAVVARLDRLERTLLHVLPDALHRAAKHGFRTAR